MGRIRFGLSADRSLVACAHLKAPKTNEMFGSAASGGTRSKSVLTSAASHSDQLICRWRTSFWQPGTLKSATMTVNFAINAIFDCLT